MFPGDSAQSATVTLANIGAQSVFIADVTATITTDDEDCDGSNFLLQGATGEVPRALTWVDEDLAKDETKNASFTIQFNNKMAEQDACQGAVVTLHYSAS